MGAYESRLEAAHHEAGHAVAAELLWIVGLPGRRVRRVVLAPAGTGVTILEGLPGAPGGPARTAAHIVFTLAGPLAQARFRGWPASPSVIRARCGGSEGDVAVAERLCADLACGPQRRDVRLEDLFEETRRLSRHPAFWPGVDAVAAALAAEGALGGPAVRGLVGEAFGRLDRALLRKPA